MNQPEETLRRFRLMLGADEADGTGVKLNGTDQGIDAALGALYEFSRKQTFEYGSEASKKGGNAVSSPAVARWLGDIRKYFPESVVKVIQGDALKQPTLGSKLMLEPEILEQTTPDIHLVATLMELGKMIPDKTRDAARQVVQKVVEDLMQKLEQKTIQSITGAIHRSVRNRRPKHQEINWDATIRKNLQHYQPDYKTIIPEVRIGFGRKNRKSVKNIILCLDQSGSMGTSVVYSGIFGAVMASIPTIKTQMVVFDTAVVDLTEDLKDPVDLLFGVQLGGGTDINKALGYCQQITERPDDTIMVLITDLYEGGNQVEMRKRMAEIVASGAQLVVILALNDEGAPSYDHANAKYCAQLGVPVFACTPDLFPELMAAAISKVDLHQWAGDHDVVLKS